MNGMRIIRSFAILLLSAAMAFSGCNMVNQLLGKDDKDDNTALWLLAAAALLGGSSGCQNQSGLVICIPPGLRQ